MRKEEGEAPQSGYRAPAVHKVFQLLRIVAKSNRGLRIVELAEMLGYSKSTTHGLVHALLRERALIMGDDGHELYLGPLIADLAFTDWNYVKINKLAQPVINDLRDKVNATVFLGVRIRTRVMITAKAEAVDSFKISAPVGATIPLFAGAAGQVLLAKETPERVRHLVSDHGLPRYTSKSTVDIEEYLAQLQLVRSRGYAIDDEEYLSGIRAVAVALSNQRGLPMAIWVVGIASNMAMEKLRNVAEITIGAARELSSQLEETRESGPGANGAPRSGNRRLQAAEAKEPSLSSIAR